jgi:hypothetical protein
MNIGNGQCECEMVLGRITHAGIGDRIDSPIMHMLIIICFRVIPKIKHFFYDFKFILTRDQISKIS